MTVTALFQIADDKSDEDFIRAFTVLGAPTQQGRWSGHATWYDTFDWKLHRKGHELIFRRSHRSSTLELLGQSTKAQPCALNCLRAPQFAQDIPDSPMRMGLERLAKRRALIPCTSADMASVTGEVRNEDGKTIVRFRLDSAHLEQTSAYAKVMKWGRISAVRGYEQELLHLSDALSAAGFQKLEQSVLEVMMQGHRRSPGDYRSKPEFWLNPAMRSDMAILAILKELQEKLDANEPGVIQDIDQDFLKHYRVAIRRSRSAIGLFKNSLPHPNLLEFRPRWQELGRRAGDVRDLDVLLNLISDHLDSIDASDFEAITPLIDHISQTRDWRRAELVSAIQGQDYEDLRQAWRAALEPKKKNLSTDRNAQQPVQILAATAIGKAHRRLIRDGKRIKKSSAPEALHDLRKQAKKLRYVLEFFSSLYAPSVMEHVLTPLQTLQDILGAFQDLEVQKIELRKAADQLSRGRKPHAETYVALGRLLATMDAEKKAARSAFKLAFEDLLSDSYLSAIKQLSNSKP